jgi:5-methylcytosine-specific restriction enzyme subunit McrC
MLNITISEYGYIACDNISTSSDKFAGVRDLTPAIFDELYNYWLEDKNTQKIFTFENKQCLKATNYVGIIQTQNLSIEILPKIYMKNNEDKYRHIFIEMLKALLNINEIQVNKANLSISKNKNIYEIFISMFVEYLDILIHRGLKSQYISKEDNQLFLKGKLKFNQHIKQNYIHKERFYVEFDEYLPDFVENRLLKSTIQLLLNKTNDYANKKALRQQLFIFDDVKYSSNYDADISKINIYRGMEYYDIPLRFAKVFLKHQSFTSLRGTNDVFALLFPMEKVFENYVEFVLDNSKDILKIDKVLVNGGRNEYFLSNDSCQMARLQPDYLLQMKDKSTIITDAKWKLLKAQQDENKDCDNINISSNDIYQIFSYLNYYDASNTAYIFVPNIKSSKKVTLSYNIKDDKHIRIIPIDLEQMIKNNHRFKKDILNETI